jgi:hypothetical protein
MDSLLLQDWVTIANSVQATGATPTLTQGATGYLDVSEFQDLVFYFDAKEVTNPTKILYQTSPTAEDSDFLTMLTIAPPAGIGAVQQTNTVLGKYSLVPPAKYVRWLCSGTDYYCTFRIWIAGYRVP